MTTVRSPSVISSSKWAYDYRTEVCIRAVIFFLFLPKYYRLPSTDWLPIGNRGPTSPAGWHCAIMSARYGYCNWVAPAASLYHQIHFNVIVLVTFAALIGNSRRRHWSVSRAISPCQSYWMPNAYAFPYQWQQCIRCFRWRPATCNVLGPKTTLRAVVCGTEICNAVYRLSGPWARCDPFPGGKGLHLVRIAQCVCMKHC